MLKYKFCFFAEGYFFLFPSDIADKNFAMLLIFLPNRLDHLSPASNFSLVYLIFATVLSSYEILKGFYCVFTEGRYF